MSKQNTNFELSRKNQNFLNHFPGTLYAYLPDYNDKKPVIHSEVLDLRKQEEGYGVFFTVNGFFGGKRDSNHLKSINAFFADIDYPDKINKNEEKIKQYKSEITMEIVESGAIPSAIVETKNGLHVYWFLEAPIYLNELNESQVENLKKVYRDIEEGILNRFDGDPGAKDLARVLRVPGSKHLKNPEDPYECKLIHYAKENVYSLNEMRSVFLAKQAPDGWAEANVENAINAEVKKQIEKEYPKLDRPSYKKLLSGNKIPEGMRNKALLIAAHAVKEAGWTMDRAFEYFADYAGLSTREVRKTVRSAFEHLYDFGYNNEVMEELASQDERKKLSEITSKVLAKETKEDREKSNYRQKTIYETYEMVVAQRFPTIKYKKNAEFYFYHGGMYHKMLPEEFRSIFMREMLKDGLTNYRKVSAVSDKIACFKSLEGRVFAEAEENPNPNILNFQNGLLDISTYKFYQHTPQYLSTTQIPLVYNPEIRAPRWLQFINEITGNDQEQARLLQQIAGYCLTTDTRYQVAFIFTGTGGNGKGTFTRILKKLVGEKESANMGLEQLVAKFGLYGIVGKRLDIIDEISGNYFESNIIKKLIAADPMSTDVKFQPLPLEFIPTVKLIFNVNDLPKINDTTPALYRRFIIVPFDQNFRLNPDINLERKLESELPGILNWCIEGLKTLHETGYFKQGKKQAQAMNRFKSENSPLVEFLTTFYGPVPPAETGRYAVSFMDVYNQYRQYCQDSGYRSKSLVNFQKELNHTFIDGWDINIDEMNRRKTVLGIRRMITLAGDEIVYNNEATQCIDQTNLKTSRQPHF